MVRCSKFRSDTSGQVSEAVKLRRGARNRSLEASALDLLAVLAGLELLVVLGVRAHGEDVQELSVHGSLEADILGNAAKFANHPLDAFLALDNGVHDVVESFGHVDHGVGFFGSATLPPASVQGNKGGEEEGKANEGQDSDNDGGEVGESVLLFVPAIDFSTAVARSGSAIAVRGGAVALSGGTVASGGSAVAGSGGVIAG